MSQARTIIEVEVESHIETKHRMRDQAGMTDYYFKTLSPTSWGKPNVDKGQDVSFTSGSRAFDRVDGVWFETKKKKNPAYWNQPRYFWIAPGPDNLAFVVVKQPRSLSARAWHKASAGIWRDATGLSWYKDHPVVDNADEAIYAARVAGKKPEPAYEIFIDGTWKRVK